MNIVYCIAKIYQYQHKHIELIDENGNTYTTFALAVAGNLRDKDIVEKVMYTDFQEVGDNTVVYYYTAYLLEQK